MLHCIGVDAQYLRVLKFSERTPVAPGVFVTAIDANHCPGAALLYFETSWGQFLHSGDMRWDPATMRSNPQLAALASKALAQGRGMDVLFLDTTFCNKQATFPAQPIVLREIADMCAAFLEGATRPLMLVGTYTIGKERVLLALAERFRSRVFVSPEKYASTR